MRKDEEFLSTDMIPRKSIFDLRILCTTDGLIYVTSTRDESSKERHRIE